MGSCSTKIDLPNDYEFQIALRQNKDGFESVALELLHLSNNSSNYNGASRQRISNLISTVVGAHTANAIQSAN